MNFKKPLIFVCCCLIAVLATLALQDAIRSGEEASDAAKLRYGDRVVITSGFYEGHEGPVTWVSGGDVHLVINGNSVVRCNIRQLHVAK